MLTSITCSFTRFKSKIGRCLQKQNNILLLLWAINSFHNKRIFEVLKVLSVFVKYHGFLWILIQIQFQIILNFTGQLKKWPKLKLMVKGKSFFFFFSIGVFFHAHWQLTGQQRKGGDQLIPLYHFHPLTNIQTFICNFAREMTITYF